MSNALLTKEIDSLKILLDHEGYDYQDGADDDVLTSLSDEIPLPLLYQEFLEQLDPGDSFWRIGGQINIQLHSAATLSEFQGDAHGNHQFVIGRFNDTPLVLQRAEEADAETAVYRLNEDDEEICVASSLLQFIQILRTGLQMLKGLEHFDDEGESLDEYSEDTYDDMNDFVEGAFEEGRDDILSSFLEELESIDEPECAQAWLPA